MVVKGLIERNLQQYRFYTPPHTIKERGKKNICMFITFRRMDGFFEAVHLKRTSVYYKRSKEKWIKKTEKISSFSTLKVSISRFPHFFYMAKLFDLLLLMKRQQSIKLWRVWRFLACWIHFSSYHPFSILFTPFFFLSLSLLHFQSRLIFSLYLWAIWTLLHNGKQRVVIFIA